MGEQPVDLKQLLRLINDQKDTKANLILDEGCYIHTSDKTSLIKVINYFLNFLHQISDKPMEISLDLMGNTILMTFMAFTKDEDIPELSPNIASALEAYNATYKAVHESGNYLQIKVVFSK